MTGIAYTRNGLAVGVWTITVDAKNSGGTTIASGETTVTIVKASTTDDSVAVVPLSGNGTLSLTINWPAGAISTPVATAGLTPVGGTASDLTISVVGNSATYSGTWSAGYYTLALQLNDDPAKIWGTVDAVRIIAGQITSGTFNVNPSTGSLSLSVIPDLQNPIQVTLAGTQSTLAVGSNMTVSTTLNPAVTPDGYQWYLDGIAQTGQTSSSITIGSALAGGQYRLDVLVRHGDTISSAGADFEVIEPAVVATISFGSSAVGHVRVNPSTNRIYASQENVPGIAVIDGTTNAIVASVPTAGYHMGLDVNPATNRIYVSQQFDCTVRVIDGSTNGIVTDIAVPHGGNSIGGVAINPNTNYLYVVRMNDCDIAVINAALGSYMTNIPVTTDPYAQMAVNTATNRLYVSNGARANVLVIDGGSNAVIKTLTLGVAASGIAVDSASNRIYVRTAAAVTVIDGTTNEVVAAIPVANGSGLAVDTTTHRIYVSDNSGTVSIINGVTNTVVFGLPVAGVTGVAAISATHRVYAACGDNNVRVIQD